MELLIGFFAAGSVGWAAYTGFPLALQVGRRAAARLERYQLGRTNAAAKVFDDMFLDVKPSWVAMAYWVAPLGGFLVLFLLYNNLFVALVGGVMAFMVPDLWLRMARKRRMNAFNAQLVDMLFMLSSALRAGLSITQAFDTLEAELGAPASQEIGLMMKAHRVGLSFDEALQGLNQRMRSEELGLIVTAILLARSTGGDVTRIINQLIVTIRDKKKLNEKVVSLTLQGKLQAIIMSLLPVMFTLTVKEMNPEYFNLLVNDPTGQTCLAVAFGLWLVGIVLLFRLAKVEY